MTNLVRLRHLSIVVRIACAGSFSLVLFAVAMLVFVKSEVEHAIYAETDARVQVAQNTMWDLLRAKGIPSLVGGVLWLGSWKANGDNSLVNHVRDLTGADATLFAIIDSKPIRVTTTIRRLGTSDRILHTELVGPARGAIDAGRNFAGVSPIAGRPFINRYDALRDDRGRVVGIVYTGIPLTTMNVIALQTMRVIVVGTLLALLLSLTLLYVAMLPLVRALRNAVTMARGLARGDVEQDSNVISDQGLGEVNLAFREMILYQQRMASVADALAHGDFSIEVTPVSERDRLGVAFARMSNKLRILVRQLEAAAMTDNLTLLGNRRAFDARMRYELSRAGRTGGSVWLALIDVDNFKAVNDDNGHQHGDVVLTRLGNVLQRVRAEDGAFRLGGDEFAVIMTDTSRDDAEATMERLRLSAQTELFGTTVSIGLAGSLLGLIDSDTLQRQADAALYVCKQRGRNIVVSFDEARSLDDIPQKLNVAAVTRLIGEGNVEVAFQPVWALEDGSLRGFEALARPDPKYGLAGPQEAFDVAAKIGRAHELDQLCRAVALSNVAELPSDAMLFLNISRETLSRGELDPVKLASELRAAGLETGRAILEIAQGDAAFPDAVVAALVALQKFGFKIALDDAGAGYSQFNYCRHLVFDVVKIDGSIIVQAVEDQVSRTTISTILAMARASGAWVVAESVDDQATFEVIYRLFMEAAADRANIGGMQGYFLGRPGIMSMAIASADHIFRQVSDQYASVARVT